MGLTDKLKKILQIKEEIRRAIIEKGVPCADNITFDRYPERIRKIHTNEGEGIDTSQCFCRLEAVSVVLPMIYCNNGCRSSGSIRHYDGAGTFPLTTSVGSSRQCDILVEESDDVL